MGGWIGREGEEIEDTLCGKSRVDNKGLLEEDKAGEEGGGPRMEEIGVGFSSWNQVEKGKDIIWKKKGKKKKKRTKK